MTEVWIRPGSHSVQFYMGEDFAHHAIAEFFTQASHPADRHVLIGRRSTREGVAALLATGRYGTTVIADHVVFADADTALAQIMDGEVFDPARAEQFLSGVVASAKPGEGGMLRIYGELVDVLCRRGQHAIAVEMEQLATGLFALEPRLTILCGYAIAMFAGDAQRLRVVCQSHDHVIAQDQTDPAATRGIDPPSSRETPSGAVPVYLIDDDPSLRRSLGRLLAVSGFAVSMFETAEAFLAAVEGLKPGCLLIDIQMPGLSGLELMAHLNSVGIDWPRLAMSGSHSEAAEREALRLGARLFLHKPFEPQVLLDAIEAAASGVGKYA